NLVQESRLTAQANDLLGTLVAARHEAVKDNRSVKVVAATGGWQAGWHISQADGGVLREYAALSGGNTLTCEDDCSGVIFRGGGHADSAESFVLCNKAGGKGKRIELQISGKARIKSGDSACDA